MYICQHVYIYIYIQIHTNAGLSVFESSTTSTEPSRRGPSSFPSHSSLPLGVPVYVYTCIYVYVYTCICVHLCSLPSCASLPLGVPVYGGVATISRLLKL